MPHANPQSNSAFFWLVSYFLLLPILSFFFLSNVFPLFLFSEWHLPLDTLKTYLLWKIWMLSQQWKNSAKPLTLNHVAKRRVKMAYPLKSSSVGNQPCYNHSMNSCAYAGQEGQVPQDMGDAKITTLYKSKGDRSDCNNYRGISLLSIVGKVFARVASSRLQVLAADSEWQDPQSTDLLCPAVT